MRRQKRRRKTGKPAEGPRHAWDVFLSHSSRDKGRARRLAERLRARGLWVWMDEQEIKPGDGVVAKIDHGLANSRRVLVLVSPSFLKSGWCRKEYEHAMQTHIQTSANTVLVVQTADVDIGKVSPLLAGVHRIDLRIANDFERLVAAIHQSTSVDDYCVRVRTRRLIDHGFGSGSVQVEPNDLLPVVLSEITPEFGSPLRLVRAAQRQVTVAELIKSAASRGPGRMLVLLGEAGIGKTTIGRLICRRLAEGEDGIDVLPILIHLGAWDAQAESIDQVTDRELGFASLVSLLSSRSLNRRLVLILDGLNEQPDTAATKVVALARRLLADYGATVIITSRPVTTADQFSGIGDLHVYEMKRWSEEQLANYFAKNHCQHILEQLPLESRGPLRLPLLASLVIRRMLQETRPSNVRVLGDIFHYIVGQFRDSFGASPKAKGMKRAPATLRSDVWEGLTTYAFEMTKARTVQAAGSVLEACLPRRARKALKVVIAELVSSGFLRCSNSVVALSPDARLNELRSLKFAFLHQSLQEYLAALHISRTSADVPEDASHDAYWREIPIYLVRMARTADQQARLLMRFVERTKPDYLTATRLALEISDPADRKRVQRDLAARLVANIQVQGLYPYSIEAFRTLGTIGLDALRSCVNDAEGLGSVFAEAEAHLIQHDGVVADEPAWRRIGRSIYILGELGDTKFLRQIEGKLPSLQSIHFLYHIGEALFTLSRVPRRTPTQRQAVAQVVRKVQHHRLTDPVVAGHLLAASWALGDRRNGNGIVVRLEEFLLDSANRSNPRFREEFWRRAHGVEAMGEICPPQRCVRVFKQLFQVEDTADYAEYPEAGYRLVHSSLLKAIARSCEDDSRKRNSWRELLEDMFRSSRVAENGWACRHLESLLTRWYSSAEDVAWVRSWSQSPSLGGPEMARTLGNVIWLSN